MSILGFVDNSVFEKRACMGQTDIPRHTQTVWSAIYNGVSYRKGLITVNYNTDPTLLFLSCAYSK